ncbi:MAG: membrane protein [Sulfurovum sp. AS07-7]|nr:MAG: membrane protein [Sulfurovum sp. AS07-7]
MVIREIEEYALIRPKARAYLCYTFSRYLHEKVKEGNIESIIAKLASLNEDLPLNKAIYVLDKNGIQISENISSNRHVHGKGLGEDRSDRAYYYKTLKENRCKLTDPYPSLNDNKLVVTSSFPIYNEQRELLYIICVDFTLDNILRMVHPSSIDSTFGKTSKFVYGTFCIALSVVAIMMFLKGVLGFFHYGLKIKEMFESTILLTLSLAIFDLIKAIFEEEVLGKEKSHESGDVHGTMVRFLGSIIIALSIEALMLVFKFAITDPSKLIFAVYLILGITALMISLSIYLKAIKK